MAKETELRRVGKKPAIRSLGVMGSITGMVGVLGLIPDLINLFQTIQPDIAEITNQAIALFGMVLALVGRIRASDVISGILVKK